jgi:hypothetical protein
MKTWVVLVLLALAGCTELDRLLVGIAGTWRSDDGRTVVLRPDGLYGTLTSTGCWDEEGDAIRFTHPCLNRLAPNLFTAYWADTSYRCPFRKSVAMMMQSEILALKDCPDAGEYKRVIQ